MLNITNFSLNTREAILNNANYKFQDSMCYQIVAENGMGKSSFLRALVGLLPYEGQVSYDEKSYHDVKNQVFFFEDNSWLNSDLNSWDYLNLVKKEWNSDKNIEREMQLFGVDKFAKVPIKKYSLGMKQKLIVCMYFVSDAKYWLMDEITNGLDAKTRQILYEKLSKKIDEKKTIIITSHYSDELTITNLRRLTLENHKLVEVKQ